MSKTLEVSGKKHSISFKSIVDISLKITHNSETNHYNCKLILQIIFLFVNVMRALIIREVIWGS